MNRLIKKLKNRKMRIFLKDHLNHGELIYIQKALNLMRKEQIAEDGLLGNQTIMAIKSVNNAKLMTLSSALMNSGKETKKQEIEQIKEMKNEPEYIKKAKSFIGLKEIKGFKNNKQIIQFHKDARLPISRITDEIPWCGSFVTSCLLHDKSVKDKLPKYGFRAKSWLNFGISSVVKFGRIAYGSMAVKSRKGGGHVTFVVGQSKSGKYLYCLGGNQGDSVKISKYKRSVFVDFRVPSDLEFQEVPVLNNNFKVERKED